MILIRDKAQCCGCQACEQKCPRHCISMQRDDEGFLYPVVDKINCVNCGLCETICPMEHPFGKKSPILVQTAYNKDESIRMKSSSGGIFSCIAEYVIGAGGVVFGARYDENWQVFIDYTETLEGISAFRGSKYVQSRTANSYKQCESFLKDGRFVLYSGTPCQIAGLKHFLRKDYNNLLTCDIVCHGSPSPEVWKRYLKEKISPDLKSLNEILFREKTDGWKNYNLSFSLERNGKKCVEKSSHRSDLYMRAFLSNLILRPSCYSCCAKEGASNSDLTLADFWGVAQYHPAMDDDKGTSLILINSEKGKSILESCRLEVVDTKLEYALPMNPGLKSNAYCHLKRTTFFLKLKDAKSVCSLIKSHTKPPLKRRIRMMLSQIKNNILKE